MEPIGTISEREWSFLSEMYPSEEADFMAQLLGNCSFVAQIQSRSNLGISPAFCRQTDKPARDMMEETSEGSFYISDNNVDVNFYHCCQGSSSSYGRGSGNIYQTSNDQGSHYIVNDSHPILVSGQNSMSIDFCMQDMTNTTSYLVEGDDYSIHENSNGNVEETNGDQPGQDQASFDSQEAVVVANYWQPIPELEIPVQELIMDDKSNNYDANSFRTPRKRSRNTGDHAQSTRRNGRASKIQKLASISNNDEGNNAGLGRAASSSWCSEDDSSGSPKLDGAGTSSLNSGGTQALNLNGKTRASRGAATDPQSLYARKRRERINERLRILQNLVPSGTKVDITTMLEEAVHYVKFLQLQIKLLSSDDLWMYAPIACNGMDIGLDMKVPTPR